MHTKRSENNFWYKCLKPNCQTTFQTSLKLKIHMRIHNNELNNCHFCPYRYIKPGDYTNHLNYHFRIEDETCDHCGLKFSTKKALAEHSSIHEGILYCCLICNKYEMERKLLIKNHLRREHSDVLGKNINWDSVKKYVKLK